MVRRAFVSDAHERDFDRVGYVIVPFLDAADVRALLDFYESRAITPVGGFHGSMYHNDLDYRHAVCHAVKNKLQERIEPYLIDHHVCLSNFMVKEPEDPTSEMPLHQDWSFVDEPEYRSVHVWAPIVDVDERNGCLAIVPGSQHLSDPVRAFADDTPFREGFPYLRERYLKELPMKAGQAILYDGRLVHGSRPNTTTERRLVAQGIAVPREATLSFSFRVSPTQVELFAVNDQFYLDYVLGERPRNVPSLGVVDYAARQLTTAELDTLASYA